MQSSSNITLLEMVLKAFATSTCKTTHWDGCLNSSNTMNHRFAPPYCYVKFMKRQTNMKHIVKL